MIPNKLLINFIKQRQICSLRNLSSQVNIEKLEQESSLSSSDFVSDEAKLREEQIEQKRNKSRLRDAHRNMLMNKNPYPEPQFFHHGTLKYLRRTYGRYGEASGVNPSVCWPIKEELEDTKEYERVKYPFTIPEMIAEARKVKETKEERILSRQAEIVEKMQKLEGWKQDLFNRIAKKEAEAKAAKERKERLVEEVKRQLGHAVDPKDEKFKDALEKKEKEQKKAMREAKRKEKEAKMMSKMMITDEGGSKDKSNDEGKRKPKEAKMMSTDEGGSKDESNTEDKSNDEEAVPKTT